ncbi:right-handed parallel beta-helix repeat-containing protein, partial [Bradyrhizobium forestalis]|uniref:right-handed parallel beta-helix repeat-containing protein n=1 Tax=Bradyrhizobium forestalis TaxID=1419263 RepID=UPI0011AF3114
MAIAGFPDANSTGLPDGVILTPSGDVTVTQPGTVIDALDVKGTISVLADNVTIQNSRITSSDWTGIWIKDGITGTVVKDSEILNVGSSPDGANGIVGSGTFLRNDIHDVENGIIVTGSSLVQDNYIHDMNAPDVRLGTSLGGPHYDGIEINGGVSDVVIRHNTVINENGFVSAVMINNDFGPVSNIQVDGNYLAGGGYTLYSDGSFSSTDKISGVSFTNNELGQGTWGYYYFRGNTPVLSNNDELGTGWQTSSPTTPPSTPDIPAAPTIASWSPDTGTAGDGITDANKIALHGTAAAGSTIKVYDGSTQIGTATATSTGGWDYITNVLTDAKHTLTATATNSSGQTSAASAAVAVTVDTKAPAAPTIASDTVNTANQVVMSGA